MKAVLNSTFTQGFKPFTITLTVETREEAVALRALHYGMSAEDRDRIGREAVMSPCSGKAIGEATASFGRLVHAELDVQDAL
jgi:hypothetical protein